MDNTKQLVVGYRDGQYIALDVCGSTVTVLAVGMVFEVWMGGEWQAVSLHSGGHRGFYYETRDGQRGRLALCMQVRLCDVPPASDEGAALSPIEQVRLLWIGKRAYSRVPVAGGYVSGEVWEVTDRGMVVFAYRSTFNDVPVKAVFPVERIGELLAFAA